MEKPADQKQLLVHIRWQGGACSDVTVQLPLNIADRVRYPSAVVDRIRELADSLPDGEIADQLNREGQAQRQRSAVHGEDHPVDPLPLSDSTCRAQEAGGVDCPASGQPVWHERSGRLLLDRSRRDQIASS